MARKVITGIIAAVLVGAIALFAAEKAQKKEFAEKPAGKTEQQAKAGECTEQREALLDQLIVAYKANDREKMGEIIKKMEQRREKMREFAEFNRWHQQAHHRMDSKDCGWRQGWAMGGARPAGPGWQMPCGGPPCQRPCCGGGMGAWGPPSGERMPMRGRGYSPPQGYGQESGPACDMPKGNKTPMDDPSPESDW
jgi:hypothetical protein